MTARQRSALRLIAGRLVAGIGTMLLVSMLIFWATQALPGDTARMILGREATADQVAQVRRQLNLDAPIATQYAAWLGKLVRGDPGQSLVARVPVWTIVKPRFENSLTLVLVSMALTIPLSIVLGVMSAASRDSRTDKSLLLASSLLNAQPAFILGMLLIVLLATNVWQLLPAVSIIAPDRSAISQPLAMVLPVLTITLLNVSYLFRLLRASLIEVLDSDYVQAAVLKGLSRRRILFRHSLPNAVIPALQATANVFAFSVGSIVVLETLFGFAGLGTGLTDAVQSRDIPVVQFIVLLISLVFVASNTVADLLGSWVAPPPRGAAA